MIYGYFDREFLEVGICPGIPKKSSNFLNTHNVVDENFDFEKMKQFLVNCSYIPNDILNIPKLKAKHKRLFKKLVSLKAKNQINEFKGIIINCYFCCKCYSTQSCRCNND